MDIIRKALVSAVLFIPLAVCAATPVNINSADYQTLMTIKGVGEKRARAIVEYRDKHGDFRSVDELSDVRGISESLVDKNRDQLTIQTRNP